MDSFARRELVNGSIPWGSLTEWKHRTQRRTDIVGRKSWPQRRRPMPFGVFRCVGDPQLTPRAASPGCEGGGLSPSPRRGVKGKASEEYITIDIFCSYILFGSHRGPQDGTRKCHHYLHTSVPPAESGLYSPGSYPYLESTLKRRDLRPSVVALPEQI